MYNDRHVRICMVLIKELSNSHRDGSTLCSYFRDPKECAIAINPEFVFTHWNIRIVCPHKNSRLGRTPVPSSATATSRLSSFLATWGFFRQLLAHHFPYVDDWNDRSRGGAGQDYAVCRAAAIGLASSYTGTALITADAGIAMVNGCLPARRRKP